MRRLDVRSALLALAAIIALCATPRRASAQWYADWSCGSSSQCASVMGGSSGTAPRDGSSFSSRGACDAWGQAYIPAGYRCRQGGSSTASSFTLRGSPARVTAQSVIVGGFVGAVLGSLAPKADTTANGYWDAGAAAGTGLILSIGLLKNRNWSRAGSAVAGAIAGAAAGAAVGIHSDGEILPGSPQDLSTPSKVGPDAAVGAAAGAVIGFAFPKSSFTSVPGLRGRGAMRVINTSRRFGINITW
jgi:hypothetical protein